MEADLYEVLKVQCFQIILDSSMVEHSAVNRGVVGSSPTRGDRPRDCPNEMREGPVVTSVASDVRLQSSAKACVARFALPAKNELVMTPI